MLLCSTSNAVVSARKGSTRKCWVRSAKPDKTVFALDPDLPISKLAYVQDALDTCSVTATKEQRRQCFETFGLDCDKVDRYYGTVSRFETLFEQNPDDTVGYQVVTSGGAGLLWIVALCLLKTP